MKLPLLLCVCFSLMSLPAWAEKPAKPYPQSTERPYPDPERMHKKKDHPDGMTGPRADEPRVYRSKKLRIHKNGQGRYGMPNQPQWPRSDD